MSENKIGEGNVVWENEDFIAHRCAVGIEVWTADHELVVGVLPVDATEPQVAALVRAYKLGLQRGEWDLAKTIRQNLGLE